MDRQDIRIPKYVVKTLAEKLRAFIEDKEKSFKYHPWQVTSTLNKIQKSIHSGLPERAIHHLHDTGTADEILKVSSQNGNTVRLSKVKEYLYNHLGLISPLQKSHSKNGCQIVYQESQTFDALRRNRIFEIRRLVDAVVQQLEQTVHNASLGKPNGNRCPLHPHNNKVSHSPKVPKQQTLANCTLTSCLFHGNEEKTEKKKKVVVKKQSKSQKPNFIKRNIKTATPRIVFKRAIAETAISDPYTSPKKVEARQKRMIETMTQTNSWSLKTDARESLFEGEAIDATNGEQSMETESDLYCKSDTLNDASMITEEVASEFNAIPEVASDVKCEKTSDGVKSSRSSVLRKKKKQSASLPEQFTQTNCSENFLSNEATENNFVSSKSIKLEAIHDEHIHSNSAELEATENYDSNSKLGTAENRLSNSKSVRLSQSAKNSKSSKVGANRSVKNSRSTEKGRTRSVMQSKSAELDATENNSYSKGLELEATETNIVNSKSAELEATETNIVHSKSAELEATENNTKNEKSRKVSLSVHVACSDDSVPGQQAAEVNSEMPILPLDVGMKFIKRGSLSRCKTSIRESIAMESEGEEVDEHPEADKSEISPEAVNKNEAKSETSQNELATENNAVSSLQHDSALSANDTLNDVVKENDCTQEKSSNSDPLKNSLNSFESTFLSDHDTTYCPKSSSSGSGTDNESEGSSIKENDNVSLEYSSHWTAEYSSTEASESEDDEFKQRFSQYKRSLLEEDEGIAASCEEELSFIHEPQMKDNYAELNDKKTSLNVDSLRNEDIASQSYEDETSFYLDTETNGENAASYEDGSSKLDTQENGENAASYEESSCELENQENEEKVASCEEEISDHMECEEESKDIFSKEDVTIVDSNEVSYEEQEDANEDNAASLDEEVSSKHYAEESKDAAEPFSEEGSISKDIQTNEENEASDYEVMSDVQEMEDGEIAQQEGISLDCDVKLSEENAETCEFHFNDLTEGNADNTATPGIVLPVSHEDNSETGGEELPPTSKCEDEAFKEDNERSESEKVCSEAESKPINEDNVVSNKDEVSCIDTETNAGIETSCEEAISYEESDKKNSASIAEVLSGTNIDENEGKAISAEDISSLDSQTDEEIEEASIEDIDEIDEDNEVVSGKVISPDMDAQDDVNGEKLAEDISAKDAAEMDERSAAESEEVVLSYIEINDEEVEHTQDESSSQVEDEVKDDVKERKGEEMCEEDNLENEDNAAPCEEANAQADEGNFALCEDTDIHLEAGEEDTKIMEGDATEENEDELNKEITESAEAGYVETNTEHVLPCGEDDAEANEENETPGDEVFEAREDHEASVEEAVLASEENEALGNEVVEASEDNAASIDVVSDEDIEEKAASEEEIEENAVLDEDIEERRTVDEEVEKNEMLDEDIEEGRTMDEEVEKNEMLDEAIEEGGTVDEEVEENEMLDEAIEEGEKVDEEVEEKEMLDEAIEKGTKMDEEVEENEMLDEAIEEGATLDEDIEEEAVLDEGEALDEEVEEDAVSDVDIETNVANAATEETVDENEEVVKDDETNVADSASKDNAEQNEDNDKDVEADNENTASGVDEEGEANEEREASGDEESEVIPEHENEIEDMATAVNDEIQENAHVNEENVEFCGKDEESCNDQTPEDELCGKVEEILEETEKAETETTPEQETTENADTGTENLLNVLRMKEPELFDDLDIMDENLLDIADEDGMNMLHMAASKGMDKFVENLLRRGVPVESVSGNGSTALQLAIMNNHLNCCQTLLRYGASPASEDGSFDDGFIEMAGEGSPPIKQLLKDYRDNYLKVQKLARVLNHFGSQKKELSRPLSKAILQAVADVTIDECDSDQGVAEENA